MPVHLINAPINEQIRLAPPVISVLVRGGAENLAAMQLSDIHASVDYMNVSGTHSEILPVRISAPLHTTVIRFNPYAVTWIVSGDR